RRQFTNKRYAEAKKRRGDNMSRRDNFSDHVQQLELSRDCGGHPFARHVVRGFDHKVPSVVLFTDRQIQDVRRFCCYAPVADSTILGVDKTFNLGCLHVTVTVFKNLSILRRSTNDHPIFLGPMFIHGSSTKAEYSVFFDFLRTALNNPKPPPSPPMTGTDDEAALKDAIAQSWPTGCQMYCHRHLYRNCSDYLHHKVGMSDEAKKPLLAAIFGDMGVTAATSRTVFDERLAHAKVLASRSAFGPYFEKRITEMLLHNFIVSQRADFPSSAGARWTNNNCESANHVLKVAIDWKPQPLYDLVQRLYGLVQSQYDDVERAIVNTGDFRLDPAYERFRCHRDNWRGLTEQQTSKHLSKFFTVPKTRARTVISTDEATTAEVPGHGGKKKGQVTRKRANRTRS
ncbi:MAG: hypothetical protein SWN10_23530, partial [Pseudomonadota bacterium]|nr:hypothetical protein [Pseudomonadota bacterium]